MFNKSLLAAALLIAGGTAVNAAEIGVRHTWGNSTVNIRNGYSETVTTMNSDFSEDSSGYNFGVAARGFEADAETEFGVFAETEVDFRRHPLGLDAETEVWGGGYAEADVDGKLAVSYSEFSRHNSGFLDSETTSEYSFGGTDTTGFSELSTFSR